MIKLYVKTGCPYCAKVKDKLFELGIDYEEHNISDPSIAAELIEMGGKRQVPFMDDEDPCTTAGHHTPCFLDADVEMYESDDIVKYIEKNYGSGESKPESSKKDDVKVHKSESGTCKSE